MHCIRGGVVEAIRETFEEKMTTHSAPLILENWCFKTRCVTLNRPKLRFDAGLSLFEQSQSVDTVGVRMQSQGRGRNFCTRPKFCCYVTSSRKELCWQVTNIQVHNCTLLCKVNAILLLLNTIVWLSNTVVAVTSHRFVKSCQWVLEIVVHCFGL